MRTACCLCDSESVKLIGALGIHPRSVLSDSRSINQTSRIYQCSNCGHWQKIHTDADWTEIGKVYASYKGHQLSDGVEQLVFPPGLPPRPRSFHALEQCIPHLPKTGRLLDFGAGDGAVLKSASQLLTEWKLDAYDISDHYEQTILQISGVKRFYSKKTEEIPSGEYDLIVLWHTLEHVPFPTQELKGLLKYVCANGKLLIQIPDVIRNPFDLSVYDHVSHFSHEKLVECAKRAGWELIANGYDWTHNCLTVLLSPSVAEKEFEPNAASINVYTEVNKRMIRYQEAIKNKQYAIWGTGMASLFVRCQSDHNPLFFIDEDPRRGNKEIEGVIVCNPNKITDLDVVLLPFPKESAENIHQKALQYNSVFHHVKFVI